MTFSFYQFDADLHHHIRTANHLERLFREFRTKSDEIGAFPNATSCLTVFGWLSSVIMPNMTVDLPRIIHGTNHSIHSAFIGFLRCFERLFIKSSAGRKRFNVLGALNAITHELIMVTNASYINAESICELFHKIAALGLIIPITLILDNARYQKCALVFELAQSLNIELLYLTTYFPNLNLIERLWKFVKKQCLYSVYYPDFSSFKFAIACCLDQSHTTHKKHWILYYLCAFSLLKKIILFPVKVYLEIA